MADWIYCGSDAQANAAGTQSLLRTHQAIWCCPPGLRPWPGTPRGGDRLWLVWRASPASRIVLLLGGGRIDQAPRASSTPTCCGRTLTSAACARQYCWVTVAEMRCPFFCLRPIVFRGGRPRIHGLARIDNRLNVATAWAICDAIWLVAHRVAVPNQSQHLTATASRLFSVYKASLATAARALVVALSSGPNPKPENSASLSVHGSNAGCDQTS